jgi:hypothetical protein
MDWRAFETGLRGKKPEKAPSVTTRALQIFREWKALLPS